MATPIVAIAPLTYGVRDAATELSCSEDTVRRLIARRELPASKVGGKVLVRREDIETLLDRTRL